MGDRAGSSPASDTKELPFYKAFSDFAKSLLLWLFGRSQGKFIPKRNHSMLIGLKALFSDLRRYSKSEDCIMDLIPMVNTADQRELVARRASIELTGELDGLVTELAEHLQKGNDTNINVVQRLTNRAIELQDRAREYEKLVNVRLNVPAKYLYQQSQNHTGRK